MNDGPRSKAQKDDSLAAMIDDLSRRYEKLRNLADQAAIGVRSALARELKVLSEKFDNLKGLAWDLRRRSDLLDGELREFERQRRELTEAMKALLRKVK